MLIKVKRLLISQKSKLKGEKLWRLSMPFIIII